MDKKIKRDNKLKKGNIFLNMHIEKNVAFFYSYFMYINFKDNLYF